MYLGFSKNKSDVCSKRIQGALRVALYDALNSTRINYIAKIETKCVYLIHEKCDV